MTLVVVAALVPAGLLAYRALRPISRSRYLGFSAVGVLAAALAAAFYLWTVYQGGLGCGPYPC